MTNAERRMSGIRWIPNPPTAKRFLERKCPTFGRSGEPEEGGEAGTENERLIP
jgi:hypothetical protein